MKERSRVQTTNLHSRRDQCHGDDTGGIDFWLRVLLDLCCVLLIAFFRF